MPVEWAELSAAMAGRGATVVLVGPDADAAGRLAAAIEASGAGRPAVFVSAGVAADAEALAAFVSEMFRDP